SILVDGVKVRYFKRLTKDHTHFSPALLWALRKEIISNKYQRTRTKEQGARSKEQRTKSKEKNELIIHIHAWWNLVSVFSCLVAKWYKIPVLLSPRGMLTSYTLGNRNSFSKRLIHSLIGKNLLRYCHIHATSEKEKQDILAVIKPKSITVISNLVELEKVRSLKFEVISGEEGPRSKEQRTKNKDQRTKAKEQGLISEKEETSDEQRRTNNETFKFIFLSRIEEKKGLDLLFNALVKLDFDWSLTIAGSGDENYVNSLKRKADSLKLSDRLDWVGQIDKKDKFRLLEEHDLLVLTSYNENFANVVIESLSVGTAVLITKEVGLYDYVEKQNLGWITSLNSTEIYKLLSKAKNDKEKRADIRSIAPKIILKDFSDKTLINRYLTIYQNLV
ncbi:MAG: glycosyltransferase, partial [Flavobacterium sp.]